MLASGGTRPGFSAVVSQGHGRRPEHWPVRTSLSARYLFRCAEVPAGPRAGRGCGLVVAHDGAGCPVGLDDRFVIGANPDSCRPAGKYAAQAGPSAPRSASWVGLPVVPHDIAVTHAERFRVAVGVPDCAYPGGNEIAAQAVPAAPRAAWC